jgi:hypothetical protein
LAKRTEFSTTRGMLFVSYQETGKKNWIQHISRYAFCFLSRDCQKELNSAHLEASFLFPIKRLAERTVFISAHQSVQNCVCEDSLGVGSHEQQQRNQNSVAILNFLCQIPQNQQ